MIKQQANALSRFKSYFELDSRNSTIKKEIIGGISTFLAMMYIFTVNPSMLAIAATSDNISLENAQAAIFLGTVLSAFIGTFFMGIFANVPIVLAPGMGLNAFFTFTVASSSGFGLGYSQALICVLLSGILYSIIAITPLRRIVTELIPKNFKLCVGIMIGFFLMLVALTNAGLLTYPNGLPKMGQDFSNPLVIISVIGIILGLVLYAAKIKFSIILTSLICLIMLLIAWGVLASNPNNYGLNNAFTLGNYNFGSFDKMAANFFHKSTWSKALSNPLSYVAIFTFLYVDFFDTTSTLFVIGHETHLIREDDKAFTERWLKKANYVDAGSTVVGAFLLNSSVTSVSESGAAVAAGARTGISAIVTSMCFAIMLAIWPLMKPLMPISNIQPITSHAIFLTGVLMMSQLKNFDWKQKVDIPVLAVTVIFGMMGYSISTGFSWGILTYVLLHSAQILYQYKNDYFLYATEKLNYKPILRIYFKQFNWLILLLTLLSILFVILESLVLTGVIAR